MKKKGGTVSFGIRLPVSCEIALSDIAKKQKVDKSVLAKEYVMEGIEKASSEAIVEQSEFKKATSDITDIISDGFFKLENRMAKLLAKLLINGYETDEKVKEVVKMIVTQIYSEDHADEMIQEIEDKVNTAAIVKIKNQKSLHLGGK